MNNKTLQHTSAPQCGGPWWGQGLKYVNHDIVFQEYPDEVTLAINLSRCPNGCPGCHSAFLGEDVGEELTAERLLALVAGYDGAITCVGFQGGDNDPAALCALAAVLRQNYPKVKVGWYSGRQELAEAIDLALFDYVKLGPWVAEQGPLSSRTTNQRMYRIDHAEDCTAAQGAGSNTMVDITSRFWRN